MSSTHRLGPNVFLQQVFCFVLDTCLTYLDTYIFRYVSHICFRYVSYIRVVMSSVLDKCLKYAQHTQKRARYMSQIGVGVLDMCLTCVQRVITIPVVNMCRKYVS